MHVSHPAALGAPTVVVGYMNLSERHDKVSMNLRLATASENLLLGHQTLARIPGTARILRVRGFVVHPRCVRSQAPAANGSRSYLRSGGPLWPQPKPI